LSFHATKAFNTFEGGAIVSGAENRVAIDRLRNFGIQNEVLIPDVGSNMKMSEFNAALGLLQLLHFEEVRAKRAAVDARYRALLRDVRGLDCLPVAPDVVPNHSYFPVLIRPEFGISRDELYERLRSCDIFCRRYFYPLLSTLPMYAEMPGASPANLPVATRAAAEILCLPIYPEFSEVDQDRVVAVIRSAQ
jgi:dTDP-4-amino-4,6-dideoxygalactose transaminase